MQYRFARTSECTGTVDINQGSILRHTEEEHGYVVQVRLYNDSAPSPESTAWGEEIADSIEFVSERIGGLAARFSIPQDRIILENSTGRRRPEHTALSRARV